MIYRSCKIRLPKLSRNCPTMLHLPTLSKHSPGWPTIFQERLVHRYITTFKYVHGLVDDNCNILRTPDIHSYNTGRRNDFRLPLAKRNFGKRRLFYQCAKEWNTLDASFKGINSLLLFKQNIKSYIF